MGILNITPDSFHADSRIGSWTELVEKASQMLSEGADILDIGGQSTRPGATRIEESVELERVLPAIETLHKTFPEAILSIDTFYASLAEQAVRAGAAIINDISGGKMDSAMFETAGRLHVPYVLTHIQGEPQTMQQQPYYEDVTGELTRYFSEKIRQLKDAGVHDIILDPGFGFGKTTQHNLQLLRELEQFTMFGFPILAGLSRKKTIQQILGVDAFGAQNGTVVAHTIALLHGASMLRVHDVKQAVESVKIVCALKEQE